jgi:hypothetical protein
MVPLHQPLDTSDLVASEATTTGNTNRIEPELGSVDVPFDVNVCRLFAIASVK